LSDFQTKEEVTGSSPVISSIKIKKIRKKVKIMKINNVNYKIYIDEKNRKVIAVCRYGGKNVKGVAKCAVEDNFNIEIGIKLATARCDWKVAKLKLRNASNKYLEAAKLADEAQKHFDKMKEYYMDSVDQLEASGVAINNIVSEIK
jgi:uncharacterized protein YfaS (alpha-2-macroglobulin family)